MGMRPSASISDNDMYEPGMICFCDIPVADLHIHMSKYGSCGLAFRKTDLVARGANPVLYMAREAMVRRTFINDRGDIPRGEYFDLILQDFHALLAQIMPQLGGSAADYAMLERVTRVRNMLEEHVFGFLKFFSSALPEDDPANYYMEREWRVLGNIRFLLGEVTRVIIPEAFATRLRIDVPEYDGQVTFSG
jgi:hypothetical protein